MTAVAEHRTPLGRSRPRPRVLVVLDYYLPGVRAGGPVRSVANMVERLGDEIDFSVITRDRDFGDPTPYMGVDKNSWVQVGPAKVRYLDGYSVGRLIGVARRTPHDVLYLSSYFSPSSIELLWAWRFGLRFAGRCIVAPRGQFGDNALQTKPARKRALLRLAQIAGVHDGPTWHATTEAEALQIRRVVKPTGPVIVAGNLPSALPVSAVRRDKKPGTLRVMCVARIHPIKSIREAVSWLSELRGEVEFDVYGPHEDVAYLQECTRVAATLPQNVRVRFPGPVSHELVAERMADYDLFFLPSLQESFGHSICEAMLMGLPVLISDRTPWRGLEARGAGWDLPLDEPHRFRQVLAEMVAMDAATYRERSQTARRAGNELVAPLLAESLEAYRHMFLDPFGA